jgi:hypothetical protein
LDEVVAPAALAVFAYRRPDHLRATLQSLKANAEAGHTHLVIFSDGPKDDAHSSAVAAVRELISQIEGFATVESVLREQNLGLARSIVEGVARVLGAHQRVIVIEDDLVVSPFFLRYMNEALDRYANEPRVASIHGYCYPTGETLPETFFLRGADCWGWATWRRAWAHFNPDGAALLQALRERGLERRFDLDGAYPYTRMLEDQIAGRNDSWAVRWHASCFLDDMLTLFPGRSLVHNIGNDASGTHSGATAAFAQTVASEPVQVLPQALEECAAARAAFARYLSRERSLWGRMRGWWRSATEAVG